MAQEFVIRISADDAATATINKIKAALGKVTEPIEKSQKSMKSLGDVGQVGLEKLKKGLGGVAHAARKVVDRIVEIIPGLTAIGGAASLAGLSALAAKFGNFGFGLNKSSKLLGMNAQDLSAWHVAAKRAGVSAEEFDSSMSGSQMAIRGAAFGADPHAMLMLQKMGVQIQHNKDGSIDYLSTQQKIMTALAKQPSVQGQRDAANALGMGALLPMIQQGTYAADKARAMRKGLVPTPDEIARATAFHQNVNDLEDSVSGLGNSIGSRLIPILDPLVTGFAKWLDANRAQIADQIGAAVQKIANWISSINWDEVTNKAKAFWDAIGGLKGVAIAIAALTFAGPLAGMIGLAANAALLVVSLAKIAGLASNPMLLGLLALGGAGFAAEILAKNAYDKAIPAGPNHDIEVANALAGGVVTTSRPDAGPGEYGSLGAWLSKKFGNKVPLGIRSNNPLNMLDHGKEITYATPEEGIAAAAKNLQRGYRGLTLAAIADKWTGGARTGNTPQQMANYVGILSSGTGLRPDETPDLGNATVVASLLKAQIRSENGKQPYSDEQINNGVGAGMGASSAPADDGHDARVAALRQHAVTITFENVPAGVRPQAKSADGGYLPTKVNYAMGTNMGAMP